MKRRSVCEDAKRVVEAREPLYGDPTPGYRRVAALWSAVLGVTVSPRQVALCMILMKVSRESGKHQWDNLVDIAGYAENLGRMMQHESKTQPIDQSAARR